jgi:hypothetical protein
MPGRNRTRARCRWRSDGCGHAVINYGELTGSGKNKLTFRQIAIDKAADIRPKAPT